MLQYLTIDMVWIIVKSKPGSGFQSWHQDFNLNEKITKTIVINLGAVKRSALLGGPLCELVNSENEDKNEGTLSTIETERRDNAINKIVVLLIAEKSNNNIQYKYMIVFIE